MAEPIGGYTIMPNGILGVTDLSDAEKLVYLAVRSFVGPKPMSGYCSATAISLGERCGKGDRQVREALVDLVAKNVLTREPNPKQSNRWVYRLVDRRAPADFAGSETASDRPRKPRGPGVKRRMENSEPATDAGSNRPQTPENRRQTPPIKIQEGKELRSLPSVGSTPADALVAPTPGGQTGTAAGPTPSADAIRVAGLVADRLGTPDRGREMLAVAVEAAMTFHPEGRILDAATDAVLDAEETAKSAYREKPPFVLWLEVEIVLAEAHPNLRPRDHLREQDWHTVHGLRRRILDRKVAAEQAARPTPADHEKTQAEGLAKNAALARARGIELKPRFPARPDPSTIVRAASQEEAMDELEAYRIDQGRPKLEPEPWRDRDPEPSAVLQEAT